MIKIAPSILACDFSKIGEEIRKIDNAGADMVHIDVMDGHFVPNISIGPPVIKCIRKCTNIPFDVHLMIENPQLYIDDFVDAGADIITVHAEACTHLHRVVEYIKKKDIKAGVALNPSTPLSELDWVSDCIDMVLVMTVNPGFGGQSYISSMTEKVRDLERMRIQKGLRFDIEVDGGIDLSNIYTVTEAGANVIVAGSTVYKAPDARYIIQKLKEDAYDKR